MSGNQYYGSGMTFDGGPCEDVEDKQSSALPACSIADEPEDTLTKTANRIRAAGNAGRGCRLSAEETHLLLFYNLPCTADEPEVRQYNTEIMG